MTMKCYCSYSSLTYQEDCRLSFLVFNARGYLKCRDSITLVIIPNGIYAVNDAFTVHDEQLVDDIPVEKLLIHDVPVDIICTPTRVIFTNTSIPKPQGIYWEKLSPEKLGQIRILRELKSRIERETGQKLPSGPSEKLPPTARRKG